MGLDLMTGGAGFIGSQLVEIETGKIVDELNLAHFNQLPFSYRPVPFSN
jgi:dTDP-D-glucose 4,6-dehydratase